MQKINNNFYNLTLKESLDLSFEQSIQMLKDLTGNYKFEKALDISELYPSPLIKEKNTSWCKTAKIIGINPRITKTFWGIVKYALTFPENCVHIMPLWESGDGSLYVQNSWRLNKDFFDKDLENFGYKTPSSQLKLVINILHAMGKIVGFDCLPHVDNFSEIVITNPKMFEWIKLNQDKSSQHFNMDNNTIYREIEELIISELNAPKNLFQLPEEERSQIIFPKGTNHFQQRMFLRNIIRDNGYEPIPVVEHSPMRPVLFDKIETDGKEDWATFKVCNKAPHSKIFGGITPYKWYKINKEGYPIKNCIETPVWKYFIDHINSFQEKYNFDFLRADMAHNQYSHSHNEEKIYENVIELWKELKSEVHKTKPYFGTFAEAFYNTYYIDGLQDMQNKNFDIVLGNMNFQEIGVKYFNWLDDFINPFSKYNFYPCITVFTNDGDLPEHKYLYQNNTFNKIRFFISLFFKLPSYMGIGFETKSISPQNIQEYTNNCIFNKNFEYKIGDNKALFNFISEMRKIYTKYENIIQTTDMSLIDFGNDSVYSWMYENNLIFIVRLDKNIPIMINDCKILYSDENCIIYSI